MLRFTGIADQTARFLEKEQLSDPTLWAKFVDIFRSQPDGENRGWRGEFWGKMMRGAALVYAYTQSQELYDILTDSVRDMMTTAEKDGRVSSYSRDTEFISWDLWGRKYVLLACEYYLEICQDEAFKREIIAFLCRAADHILAHIGPDKKSILVASKSWFGLNSSSILEPIVRLYRLTGEKRYLDFASYIVNEGGALGINVFELAYENKLYPYQYGVSKAYEMMSCFEGLLEYYLVTGIEKYKTSVINFAHAVLDSEISIIGCSGVTHELFDHTRMRQTALPEDVVQETCVTVTWMKFCSRLLELTGDSRFADAMEQSFYNAYLGALNTEHRESTYVHEKFGQMNIDVIPSYLAFDSYSPLLPSRRGEKVGGNQLLPDHTYYGCCACIGSAGVGVFLSHAVIADDEGITCNFYESGTATLQVRGVAVTLTLTTDYPLSGDIRIDVQTERPVRFALKLRNPGWSKKAPTGYTVYEKEWTNETVTLHFDMPIEIHHPETWEEDLLYTDMSEKILGYYTAGPQRVHHEEQDDAYFAVTRGPITLAADSRLGKPANSVFEKPLRAEKQEQTDADPFPSLLKLRVTTKSGTYDLVDYASAGKDWETDIAAWLPSGK